MTANVFLVLFVWFVVPETKQVALEEIDVLFGGANHIEKGGDLLQVEDAHHAHLGVDNVDNVELKNGPHVTQSEEQPIQEIRE